MHLPSTLALQRLAPLSISLRDRACCGRLARQACELVPMRDVYWHWVPSGVWLEAWARVLARPSSSPPTLRPPRFAAMPYVMTDEEYARLVALGVAAQAAWNSIPSAVRGSACATP